MRGADEGDSSTAAATHAAGEEQWNQVELPLTTAVGSMRIDQAPSRFSGHMGTVVPGALGLGAIVLLGAIIL